jgi:serine protease AprX
MAAENKPGQPADRLPIKLIMPRQGVERRVPGGGNPPKPFREVDPAYRRHLANQVAAIREGLLPALKQTKVAPMRVRVLPQAAAKSHRPEKLFSAESCPIIGAGRLGELYVKATARGLSRLAAMIEENTSEQITKELSCIESIEPVTPMLRRRGQSALDILQRSPKRDSSFVTRVSLFDFGGDEDHGPLRTQFEALCEERGIALSRRGYNRNGHTYAAHCRTTADIDALAGVVGVRSISHMPLVRMIRPRGMKPQPLPALPRRASDDTDVPVVVVVDSGVTDTLPALQSWVVGRNSTLAPEYSNTDHGSFVAGLICWGHLLNPTLAGLDNGPCAVYDLQVIPNDDPERGDTAILLENELLSSLEQALQEHANRYKVWNLSLGSDEVCSLDEFSKLAEELDNLQERFAVSFVISAGNYSKLPLLDYPRRKDQLDDGRITAPADSVLGITVGAVSHVEFTANGPGRHAPSAFSRHGAGPNYIIKPDLVHYGGSCSTDAAHLHGIRSITAQGVIEDMGTSFSTPLVSRTLAQIYHQITPTPSPVLARALLTHHARDPRSGLRVPDGEENFLGFGMPKAVPYCLECTPHTATLVFDDHLRPGYFLEWDHFPYPPSLTKNGRFFGEIWMTIAFSPSRGARWGSEYCETHIDAHLGVYRETTSRATGEISTKFTGLVPPEHRNAGQLYETYQVEKMRKWAPVRTYHGRMGDKGERGTHWRLMLRLLTRHGAERGEEGSRSQPFSLVITIADPLNKAPVYDEMAQIVRTRFQAENLAVRSSVRLRGRG